MNSKITTAIPKGTRWPVSITYAATRLGVGVQHLHKVLNGQRISHRVLRGYDALVREQRRATKAAMSA